jgi:hypothetical protein
MKKPLAVRVFELHDYAQAIRYTRLEIEVASENLKRRFTDAGRAFLLSLETSAAMSAGQVITEEVVPAPATADLEPTPPEASPPRSEGQLASEVAAQ